MISKKEKKKRQHEKELKSFRNKIVNNIVWFDSLSKTKQYDLLFLWKKEKYKNKLVKPQMTTISTKVPIDPKRPWGKKKIVRKQVLKYPPSVKHFIIKAKISGRFFTQIQKVRNTAIDLILNKK